MFRLSFTLLCIIFVFISCRETNKPEYPAAEGFNAGASDPQAIAITDSVMQAMGGYEAWKNTPVITWNFFGRRTHTWDKFQDRDRIEIPGQNMVINFNIKTKEGTVTKNGEKITQPDSLDKYLQKGYEMWANDSYWLFMPYKLKDSGVTLAYMGIDTTQESTTAHKLKLTFDNVGVTPDNKYHVYVDTADYLVRQWAYFPEADMEEPGFVLPWRDYKRYGNILLSGNRGKYTLSNIKVMDEWPEFK